MTPIAQALAIGVIAISAATGAVNMMSRDIPDFAVPEGPWQASGALDGRVFHTVDRIKGSDEVLHDELHFADGRFQSAMCQQYCDFGWSEYQVKYIDDTLHFTATTRCPDAPHTVVWYGAIQDDQLRLEGTWTTRRWYWTHQMEFEGRGSTTASARAVSGT